MVMESIFIRQNLQSGIIFIGEKHLKLEECSYKDAFATENNPSESLKHFQDAWRCKDRAPEAFSGCMQGRKRYPKTWEGELIIEEVHKSSCRRLLKNRT